MFSGNIVINKLVDNILSKRYLTKLEFTSTNYLFSHYAHSVHLMCKLFTHSNKLFFKFQMDRRESLTVRKGKRFRSAFTTDQVNYLEKEFKKFPYIGTAHRKEVAHALNIHERAVKIWFQNRRMKEKKDAGNKDQESDDQIGRKNIGLVNDKLNNVISMPSVNDPCYSLPQITTPTENTLSNAVIMRDVMKIEPTAPAPEPLKLNYYNDISPRREANARVTYPRHTPPPITSNPQVNYRSSAEFSIDLCKKYKNTFPATDGYKINNNNFSISNLHKIDNDKLSRTTPPHAYPQENFPKFEQQCLPEDLSCRSSVAKHQELSPPNNADSNSPEYIPFYVNYPQPYLSAGNMLWKPVNVLPIMSTGVSAVNISSSQSGSLSVSREQNLPRKKCNCDCHLELPPAIPIPDNNPNAQPQYVITALPFQNYPKF